MSKRFTLAAIITLIILSLCYAFYAQLVQHQEPCPLCIVERVVLAAIILPALLFLIHNPKCKIMQIIYSLLMIFLAGFGLKVSMHHVWLTNLPPEQQPLSCGMPLAFMYQHLPLNSFLQQIMTGSGNCAKVDWRILGISAPMAVAIFFAMIILATLYTLFRAK